MLERYLLPTVTRLLATVSMVVASALFCTSAHAEEKAVVAAASAFTRAQQAELSGEHTRAAELYELADRIAPTPEALRSATRNRLSAGQVVAAASNAEELLRRYPADASSRELAEQVLSGARPTLARLALECAEPCTVLVDGLATALAPLRKPIIYLAPGSHQLTIAFEGARDRVLRVQAAAGDDRTVHVTPPAAPRPNVAAAADARGSSSPAASRSMDAPPPRDRGEWRGPSPVYFWVAAGLTVAAAGATLWSGLDLLHARDDFEANPQPTQSDFDAGERKDLRTSLLLGATGALVATTAVLGWLTPFRADATARAALAPRRDGVELSYRRAF